jgi:molecular chaperone HtpG
MNGSEPILIAEGSEDAPEQLVKQFTEPFDCLRELLQNAIDAGSGEVHVACTFEEDCTACGPGLGAAVLRVKDYGEGMDRHAIDTRLVRLFSSDKLRDRTKIGKFGIGFISVFAMQPDVVCVDTGRNGESWRLLFRPDRSFLRVYLPEPIEGTTVRLWKAMSRAEFELFEPRVRRALHHHGQHLDIPLTYQGTLFNTPLHHGALVHSESRVNGETIVVSYLREGEPEVALFANHGLTLLSRPSDISGVSYAINSPRLAHTMGRDNIVQDEHYALLMKSVRELAAGPLIDELSQKLDEGLRGERPEGELLLLQKRLAEIVLRQEVLPTACAERLVARSVHGELHSLQTCLLSGSAGRLYWASHPSPLSAAVRSTGKLVLEEWQLPLLQALCRGEPPRLERTFFLALPLDPKAQNPERTAQVRALCGATRKLIHAITGQIDAVELGYLDYPGSGVGGLPAVVQAQPFALGTLEGALPQQRFFDTSSRYSWVLNADHLGVKALLPLCETEPELAAYNLIKLCLVGGAMSPELDSRLLTLALEERCQRQESDR